MKDRHGWHHAGGRGRGDGKEGERRHEYERGEHDELHRRGGRRRMFDGEELRLLLLRLIADTPRHGYDLVRALEERSQGSYVPSAGVIYPTLTLLTEMELLGQPDIDDKQRKLFSITRKGQALLDENKAVVQKLFKRLDAAAAVRARTDAAPVRRAMHNLKSALLEKLSSNTDSKVTFEIAALIDEATQKIERLGS